MKHNIRQRVINQYGLPVTKVESVNGELGSGIFDKNGVEIFEGDILQYDDGERTYVVWSLGAFICSNGDELPCAAEFCEVVGHVNAPTFKDTGRAWSPQLHDAYNRLLDAFIARKSPETLCEAALAVVKAAKADNRFEETDYKESSKI